MNTDEALKKLASAADGKFIDNETIHTRADEVLLEFLKSNGHEEVAEAWEKLDNDCGGFWYA